MTCSCTTRATSCAISCRKRPRRTRHSCFEEEGVSGYVVRGTQRAAPMSRPANIRLEACCGYSFICSSGPLSMSRMWAIVERELRRFRRSPVLMVMSMIFPLAQLIVLGYAFGGNVHHLRVAVVDQDHGLPAGKIRALAQAAPPRADAQRL